MVCVYIIGDLIVITVMYFDAYLKGRNAPPSHPHPQQISQVTTQAASKFTMLRPPNIQATSITAKSPFPETRNDNYKQNTSAHIFLSAAKPPGMPQRVASNYPIRLQTNPVSLTAFSRQQVPQEQRYICHSPGKGGSRTSAGLVFEQIPQNRYDYRRSESIAEMKPNGESFRDSSINYCPQGRQPNEYLDTRNSTFSNSQLQLRFNPYPEKGKASRKESAEGTLLTNRQERAEPPIIKQPYSQKKIFKEYSQLFQYKPQIPSFDPNKFEYISARTEAQPKKYDLQTRKFQVEGKKSDAYKNFEEVYRNSLQTVLDGSDLKRQNSQDFLKKYSNSKLPDLDESLQQDIENLRFTSRKSDEIIDRQLSKNTYLNQLFEQRGVKNAEQRPEFKETLKQKKEAAARNIAFERELEERNRELSEKGRQLDQKRRQIEEKNREITQMRKQIEEKNKVIEDKNTKIEEISAQLKEFQQTILKKEYKWAQLQNNYKNQLTNFQKRLNESVSKVAQLQRIIKQNQHIFTSKLQQKEKIVILLQSSLEQYRNKAQSLQNQLNYTTKSISIHQKTIQQYQKKFLQLTSSLSSLKQQSQAQKLSLISLYKKQNAQLKAMFESERIIQHRSQEEGAVNLQAEIVELRQRNNLLQEQLSNIAKQHKEKQQKYDIVFGQYLEIGSLLLVPQGFSHQKLIFRVKQCLQSLARSEGMQTKEAQRLQQYQVQKLQQEHLERRHQELSRQLKKVGSRLAGASIQVQQGGRLLREANQTIISMNLLNLNEKYRFLLENQ